MHQPVTGHALAAALRLSMSFGNNEADLERAMHSLKQELGGKTASARPSRVAVAAKS